MHLSYLGGMGGIVWGLVITKGMLLITVWILYTPMNVCTYKRMVTAERIEGREEASF